jgi:hypothetical protein
MERFVRGLSSFANSCRQDLTSFHVQEESLNAGFRVLKHSVKQSLLGSPKPKAVDPRNSAVRSRSRTVKDDQKLRLPSLEVEIKAQPALQPLPFPVRRYALPSQPCKPALRLFQPKVGILELIDEYLKYPNPEGALLLDGTIDPVLRVGAFNPNELKWNEKVPVTIV